MKAKNAEMTAILFRLAKIERQNRNLKRVAALILLVVATLPLLAWAQQGKPRERSPVIKASEFVLIDTVGRERAALRLQDDGAPGLFLSNSKGRILLKLRLHGDDESQILIADAKGNTRFGLATAPGGEPHLVVNDKHQKPRIQMTISERGAQSLLFISEKGEMGAGMGLHADGRPWTLPAK